MTATHQDFTTETAWTRAQVESLQVGDYLSHTIDTRNGRPLPNARWTEPRRVVEITFRGIDVKGRAFVGFYTDFGPNSRISGSIKDGDGLAYRMVGANAEAR